MPTGPASTAGRPGRSASAARLLLLPDQGDDQRRGRDDHHRRRQPPRRGGHLPGPGQGRLPRRRPRPDGLRLADERAARRRRAGPPGAAGRGHRHPASGRRPLRRGVGVDLSGLPARSPVPPAVALQLLQVRGPSRPRHRPARSSSVALVERTGVSLSGEVYASPSTASPCSPNWQADRSRSPTTSAPATSACRCIPTCPMVRRTTLSRAWRRALEDWTTEEAASREDHRDRGFGVHRVACRRLAGRPGPRRGRGRHPPTAPPRSRVLRGRRDRSVQAGEGHGGIRGRVPSGGRLQRQRCARRSGGGRWRSTSWARPGCARRPVATA